MAKAIYSFAAGSRLPKRKAQAIGECLAAVHDELDLKHITPDDVITAGRPVDSPLHDQFQWDDKLAGHQYRLWQARHILGRLTFRLVEPTPTPEMPAYHSLQVAPDEREYTQILEILTDEKKTQMMLEQAFREAESWARRYEGIRIIAQTLGPIFRGIRRARLRLDAAKKPKGKPKKGPKGKPPKRKGKRR